MATLRKKDTQHGYHYVVDFTFRGKRHVITTQTADFRLAKQILHDIQGKIARGTFKLEEYQEKHINLKDFAEQYFKFASSYKMPNTIALEHFVLNNFIKCLGDLDLRFIDAQKLDEWKRQRLTEIRPVTFNLELRTLKAFLNVAVRWEYISSNPISQIHRLKVEEKRLYMTDSELKKFFDALLSHRENSLRKPYRDRILQYVQFFEFLLNTGLRREEGTQLAASDVDLEAGQVHIRKTKDKEARDVPLTDRAREILIAVGDKMFSELSNNSVTKTFTQTCKNAGLVGFKLHSLRHTFATRLIELGVDVLTVSKILGHSDINTTMVYAKVQRQTMQNAVARLNGRDSVVTIRLLRGDKGRISDEPTKEIREFISNYCARDRT
jgi:integrase